MLALHISVSPRTTLIILDLHNKADVPDALYLGIKPAFDMGCSLDERADKHCCTKGGSCCVTAGVSRTCLMIHLTFHTHYRKRQKQPNL